MTNQSYIDMAIDGGASSLEERQQLAQLAEQLHRKMYEEQEQEPVEKCFGCGCDIVFESYEGSPPEYDVCEGCGAHVCPKCSRSFEDDESCTDWCKICFDIEKHDR